MLTDNKSLINELINMGNQSENVKIIGKTKEERKAHFKKIYYGGNNHAGKNSSQGFSK